MQNTNIDYGLNEVEFAIDENFPGWQEIVPYTGENEKQKIEGKGDTE